MKIALISGGYPTPELQFLVFVQQLVEQLIDQGVEVTVIAPQSIDHCVVHKEPLLPYKTTYSTKKGHEYFVYRPKFFSFGDRGGIFGAVSRLTKKKGIFKVLNKIQYDCIYTHFWEHCLPVYNFCRDTSTPLFIACGEGDNALETMVETMPAEELKKLKEAVTGVISVSTENKRKCIEFNLADESDISVIPNCVDDSIFHPKRNNEVREKLGLKPDDFAIMFVGGFIHRKGPDRVAQAITNLNDKSIKSIFVGKFFDGEKVDPICDGIVHKGGLHHDDLPNYLNAADLFVLPTLKEGCCNAIVEALACAVPVVSSDRPFNEDILNKNNSILVNPEDVDEITNAIKRFKSDAEFYQSVKSYLLAHANNYSISGRAKAIVEFINNQISKKKK